MNKLYILMLFILFFTWRWLELPSSLPEGWTPESEVRFTATILDGAEHTDTKTIVRSGIWYIAVTGYTEIIPGSRVKFVGKVEPQIVMGKAVRIVMNDAEMEKIGFKWNIKVILGEWRERWVGILEDTLPEPMASLAAGILLGVRSQMPSDFYQALINTGTLHIVAASGYNVNIVAAVIMAGMMTMVSRGWAIGVGVVGIVIYVLLAGASASVVRAGIMGSLTLIAYYFGRPVEARRLLWVVAGLMLLFNPLYIVDIGFQLSFAATAGLLYIPFNNQAPNFRGFLANYFYPTLVASVATLPIILYHFGRVSWISPMVNVLVLPVVPLIMLLSALSLVGGHMVAWVAYVPLAYLVWVIKLFGG